MKLTQEQKEAIINEIGQSRFDAITSEKIEYDKNKIYLYKHYKLQRVDETHAWVDLYTSICLANGWFDSAETALKSYKGLYTEYGDIQDAIADGYFDRN